jgi:hypothetical protein
MVQQSGTPSIIAAAPSSQVSTSERSRSTTLPPTQSQPEPSVATATAQVIAQQPQQNAQVQQPQQPVQQPQQNAQVQQPRQTVQPQQPVQQPQTWQPQAQQPVQPTQPQESSPLPPLVDRGTALIKPYMPNADNKKIYRVQVGSYQFTWHAIEAYDRLTTVGFRPAYERYGDYIRVVIPGVPAVDMPSVARLLGRVGFTEALIREEN